MLIERLWRSLKCECIYLNALLDRPMITCYNRTRPHSCPRRQNAGGCPYGVRRHQHGGVTHTRTKLSQAAKLSDKWGPPHPDSSVQELSLVSLAAVGALALQHRSASWP